MKEKRKYIRIPLNYYLKVTVTETRKHHGYMIDVSEEGFKLLSEEQIPTGSELICSLHLPDDLKGWTELSFKAKSCWSGKDINPDYYVSGCHIDRIDPVGETVISIIIHLYGHKI
jgi:hypothetical protein